MVLQKVLHKTPGVRTLVLQKVPVLWDCDNDKRNIIYDTDIPYMLTK
jgi:hypothetical protein